MGDIIDNEEVDKDTVEPQMLEKLFSDKYTIVTEKAVSLNKSYINKLSGTQSLKLAVSLLDNSIEVYELNNTSLARVCRLSGHKKALTEVVVSSKEDHLVYSCGLDGLVKLWDTRASGTCVQEYKDEDDAIVKPFECMDISCNERVLCAGSQLVTDDAYLVFWDRRHAVPLGGYWNSHTDDITQVKFHRRKPEILATGSLDGLLNIFNIFEQSEDNALTYSLNVENSVERISWLDDENVACITQSNDLQVWDVTSGDQVRSYARDKVARSIKRSKSDDCYLVEAYTSHDQHVVLAGSYAGNGHTLRSVTMNNKKLNPKTNYTGNKQVVRCCWYDRQRDLLVTAGESGIISVWGKGGGTEDNNTSHRLTTGNRGPAKRRKPY